MTTPRLQPLEPPYDETTADALRRLMGPVAAEPLALFRTLAHHDALLDRFRQVGSTLLSFGRVPAADRETIIHRTTARCGAAYEWGVHAALYARATGRDEDWLRATWEGAADDPAFTPEDALLVTLADELHDRGALTDATYAALAARYTPDQLVELTCLAGFYHLVSFVCGAFTVALEPWAARPPGH